MTPVLPTPVVGSYSVPEWLERLKTDYYRNRISRSHLRGIHDMAIKAALKDQEKAGIDIVSDGELRRDNDIDYFLARIPGVQILVTVKSFYYDYYDTVVTEPLPTSEAPPWGLADDYRFARPSWEYHYDFLFPAVLDANVDQLILEFARKGYEDLEVIQRFEWDRALGLGVMDVKTEQIESVGLITQRIHRALGTFPADKLIINPDCGLCHLPAHVARSKLSAMVEGTVAVRRTLPEPTVEQGA
jgi:methionine synthase II (cobalamin-independent)